MVLRGNPEIKRWVDRSIEAGTCADAKAELRSKNEEFRQWLHEQREDLPMPERNPDFDWMDEFRMKPRETSALPAPAKNAVGSDKPRPTNQAVRQWVRDRVTSWPDDKSTPSEDDDWNAARRHLRPDCPAMNSVPCEILRRRRSGANKGGESHGDR
jgi:hypothetical protein